MIFGVIGGMKFGRGNQSTRRKPTPAPLCPPQIPHDQTQARSLSVYSRLYFSENIVNDMFIFQAEYAPLYPASVPM
jgi:hypothetical protein